MPEEKQYVLPMPRRRGVIFFLLANVFAFALCASIWALVWYGDSFTFVASAIWSFLAAHSGADPEEFADHLYTYYDEAAVAQPRLDTSHLLGAKPAMPVHVAECGEQIVQPHPRA